MGKNLFKSGNTAAKTVAKVGGKRVKEGIKISVSVAKLKGKQALRSFKGVVTEAIGEEVEDSRGTRLANPTGGEFVVSKESRVLYSCFALFNRIYISLSVWRTHICHHFLHYIKRLSQIIQRFL